MADPTGSTETQPGSGAGLDAEVEAFLDRANKYIDDGRLLPPPETWTELLAGLVVWLLRHWSDEAGNRKPCGNCGSSELEIGSVVSFTADARWPVQVGQTHGSYPYFQIGCRTCGNTIFINALLVFAPQAPKLS
jgi:hypothetical protein